MHPGNSRPVVYDFDSSTAAFLGGLNSAFTSVFAIVMAGTYVGMGALAHSFGLSSWWLAISTVLVWSGPVQLILMSAIGAGTSMMAAAVAVFLGGIRLFPMVVALLPLLKGKDTLATMILLRHCCCEALVLLQNMREYAVI